MAQNYPSLAYSNEPYKEEQADIDESFEKLSSLIFGGGGGTYDDMSVIDAKIAAAEARTDTKFAQVLARLDNIEKSTSGLRLNVWLAAATALGLGIAAMAFGAAQFGNGIMVTSASVQDAQEAKRISQENARAVEAMRTELSTFISDFKQTPAWNSIQPKQ